MSKFEATVEPVREELSAASLPAAPPEGRVRRFFKSLGPGLITGAADDDPSGIGTYAASGMIGSGLLAVPILSGSAAFAVCELFGWPCGLDTGWVRARNFYVIILVATALGAAMTFSGIKPIAAGFTPAAYPEVITVSALADSDGQRGGLGPATSAGPDDSFATFSNYGAVVDLTAPGVDILSTAPGDAAGPGGYCQTLSGTSMASPHAAGAAALYLATHPKPVNGAQVAAVRDYLRATGECPDGSVFGPTGCATRWRNDPDGITEPLVNVTGY